MIILPNTYAKGVSRDSSTDKCLPSHWDSSHFPLPSLKDILLNINTYFASYYEGYHWPLFFVNPWMFRALTPLPNGVVYLFVLHSLNSK